MSFGHGGTMIDAQNHAKGFSRTMSSETIYR